MAKVDIKDQVPDCSRYLPTPRSLQASSLGIEKARKAFKQTLWTQEYLASEVGIQTRQPIWKFFTGKPIERHIFLEICFKLHLDWQEIAGLETQRSPTVNDEQVDCSDIGALVQLARARHRDKIQAQCVTIRLLDLAQLIELNDIYVSVNVLEALPSQNWIDISNLQCFSLEESKKFYSDQISTGIPALKAVSTYCKLMLLGKPGSGKTTFLQHIALQCNQGEFLAERLPIFIRLKDFVEDASETGNFSLLSYIAQELGRSNISVQQVETLLNHGKGLILLDGLDEVQKEYKGEILKQIRKLSGEYYKNHFIITCRIASQQYCFEGFTDVEIADFDQPQIEAFVQKWFVTVGRNSRQKGLAKATQFTQQLQLSENRQIRELARNPLLLNLACSVFQATSQFPVKRSDLYKQGLDILLVRWDEVRGIKRDETYRHLSLSHKIKLLSQIAAIDFEQGNYFFAQSNVQQYITDYLRTLPNAQSQPEEVLQLNSEAVLKSISVQHGLLVERAREIYSFSHLTFQEYLTARNFVATSDPQILDKNLVNLVSHMHETRWREVFLLTTGMLANADALMQLMQQHSNNLMATDEMQQFLIWLHQKSLSVEAPYKSAGIHAFYLTLVLPCDLTLARDLSLALAIDPRLAGNLAPDLALDLALTRVLSLSHAMPCDPAVEQVLALSFALPDERTVICDPRLQRSLQQLKEQLPALNQSRLKEWWSYNGQAWAEELRFLILRYRHIGHQWQFSHQQKQEIQHYYAAHQLLVDCLNSTPKVTPQVRKEIEETLLLPISEIEHRQKLS